MGLGRKQSAVSSQHIKGVCIHVQLLSRVQLFCNPMDCSLPGSSVHGISQARILEWVAISFSRGSSWPRDWTHISCIGRQVLYHWATWKACGKVLSIVKSRLHHSQLFNMFTVFQYNTSSSFGCVDGTLVTEATIFQPWGRLVWRSSWNTDTGPFWH